MLKMKARVATRWNVVIDITFSDQFKLEDMPDDAIIAMLNNNKNRL